MTGIMIGADQLDSWFCWLRCILRCVPSACRQASIARLHGGCSKHLTVFPHLSAGPPAGAQAGFASDDALLPFAGNDASPIELAYGQTHVISTTSEPSPPSHTHTSLPLLPLLSLSLLPPSSSLRTHTPLPSLTPPPPPAPSKLNKVAHFLLISRWSEDDGSARRRRMRRLRQWQLHERMTFAMGVAEATHHSAPRRQKTATAIRDEGGARDALRPTGTEDSTFG